MAQGTQVCHCEAPTGPWQSHAGSCDFADGFPVVRPCSARLPRRFAPRNDTSGAFTIITIGCSDRQHCAGAGCPLPYNGVCGRRQYAQICCCQRRSLTAATDAIGFYVFNGSLYELQVPSRDCHGSCGASQRQTWQRFPPVSLRGGRKPDAAISSWQQRVRRGFPMLRPGTARLPRLLRSLAMTNRGLSPKHYIGIVK